MSPALTVVSTPQEVMMWGQLLLTLAALAALLVTLGKILERLERGNTVMTKLEKTVEELGRDFANSKTRIALLEQRNEIDETVHFHRRRTDLPPPSGS